MSVLVSDSFDDYASGRIAAHQIKCVLCQTVPCSCPEFGTPEYFALLNERHGKAKAK